MKWQRILERRKALGLTQLDVAKGAKVSKQAVSKWEKGDSFPKGESLFLLAKVLKCDANWILTGRGTPELSQDTADGVSDADNAALPSDGTSIPFYDVYASAGYGLVPYEGQPSYMDIHPLAVQDLNLSNTKDLFFMKVKGDSMEPALYEEDAVLVRKLHDIPRLLEGIYVINVDGQLLIKHIQLNKFEEWITLTSLNESYKAYEIKGSDLEAVHIVGEVIRKFAKVRKMSRRTLESVGA